MMTTAEVFSPKAVGSLVLDETRFQATFPQIIHNLAGDWSPVQISETGSADLEAFRTIAIDFHRDAHVYLYAHVYEFWARDVGHTHDVTIDLSRHYPHAEPETVTTIKLPMELPREDMADFVNVVTSGWFPREPVLKAATYMGEVLAKSLERVKIASTDDPEIDRIMAELNAAPLQIARRLLPDLTPVEAGQISGLTSNSRSHTVPA